MTDAAFFEETYSLPLSTQERRVLRALHEGPKTSLELARLVAAREPDVYSIALARIHVSKVRRKLRGTGWEIPTETGGRKPGGVGQHAAYELRREKNGEQ